MSAVTVGWAASCTCPASSATLTFSRTPRVEECLLSPKGNVRSRALPHGAAPRLRFYPWKASPFTSDSSPEFIAINAHKNRGDNVSGQCSDARQACARGGSHLHLGSLTAIQTARAHDPRRTRLAQLPAQAAAHRHSDGTRQGLHRLGRAMPSPANPTRTLCARDGRAHLVESGGQDWCSAQREGAYTIHPTQIPRASPLHTTDAMLAACRTDEISLGELLRDELHAVPDRLANIIRESIDLRNEQSMLGGTYDSISPTNRKLLQVKLETFLADLPPFNELESNAMHPPIVAVQRSLLHQQAFNVLLSSTARVWRRTASARLARLLAEQIVSTQTLLRSVCPVIDGFWVNFLHLFGATLTLIISLLLDSEMDAEARERRRRKVHTR